MARVTAFIGVGANLGDARESVLQAIARLTELRDSHLSGRSSLFRSVPIEAGGADFVNAVVRIETGLTADELLTELQAIENDFGRERPYVNAPRTMDLDVLLFGPQQINTEKLVVPHPRLTERAFALIPTLQIDPFVIVPGKGAAHMFAPAVANQSIFKIDPQP